MSLLIERYSHGEKQTIGNLHLLDSELNSIFNCDTLELPWLNNQRNISCIPTGKYIVKKRYSKKYRNHLHVTDVDNRTWILIHSGNYHTDILGCVLVGELGFVDDDDTIDVGHSRKTLRSIMSLIDVDELELEIVDRL
jgi:hypothetical protein